MSTRAGPPCHGCGEALSVSHSHDVDAWRNGGRRLLRPAVRVSCWHCGAGRVQRAGESMLADEISAWDGWGGLEALAEARYRTTFTRQDLAESRRCYEAELTEADKGYDPTACPVCGGEITPSPFDARYVVCGSPSCGVIFRAEESMP